MGVFHYLQLTAAGGIFCHGLQYLLESYLVRRVFEPVVQQYSVPSNGAVPRPNVGRGEADYDPKKVLSDGDVAEISTKLVSMVYATVVAAAGVGVMWQARDDVMYGRSSILKPFVPLIVWYFIYDLHAMFRSFCLRKSLATERMSTRLEKFVRVKWVFIIHHLVLLIGALLEILGKLRREGLADFALGTLFFRELSNPFVLMAQVLNMLSFEKSTLFKINGVAVIISFFVCRILNTPVLFLLFAWQHYALDFIATARNMKLVCYVFGGLEMVLELYWFFGILRLAVRAARSARKSN